MKPEDYFKSCYKIRYNKDAKIGKFGEPMNCYGFVYWFYKRCMGISLEEGDVTSFDSIKCVEYHSTTHPVDGDVVKLRTVNGNGANHIGVVYQNIIYHFTSYGLIAKSKARMANWVEGYYHVEDKN